MRIGDIAAAACVHGVAFVQLAALALVHRNVQHGLGRDNEPPAPVTGVESSVAATVGRADGPSTHVDENR